MQKGNKFHEFINFHQTHDSSHIGECLKSENLTFFKMLTKTQQQN